MVNGSTASLVDIRLKLLQALESGGTGFVSGAALSRQMAVSRTSIWKHIRALRGQGYVIDAQPHSGYRLVSCPDGMVPLEVRRQLRCEVLGREVHCLARVGSTQDEAFRLAQEGSPEGTLVIAGEQVGGRGRVGRAFFSPPGGLWFSLILRPHLQPQACLPVTLMAGVAVSEAIREATGLPAILKWPNDVLIGGRKAVGILAELVAETDAVRFVICGIGVNANIGRDAFPAELAFIATSLSQELGHEVPRTALLCRIVERLDRWYADFLEHGQQCVVDAWRRSPNILGSRVQVSSPGDVFQGVAAGLDAEGALLVKKDDGSQQRVTAGDVHLAPIRKA